MRCTISKVKFTRHFNTEKLSMPVTATMAAKMATTIAATIILSACGTADKVDSNEQVPVQTVAADIPETAATPVATPAATPEIDIQPITADGVEGIPKTTPITNFDQPEEPVLKDKPIQKPEPEQETLNITLATLRAERGDLKSQVALGMAYASGTPRVEKDPAKAKLWFELASLKGDSQAQYELGKLFYTGQGVDKDYFNAREWWLESAAQGNLDAQQKLGYLYSEGLGVQRDFDKAKLWYSKAAKRGHAEAQTLLGSLYHEGNRIPTDYSEAFKWYKLAAEQGHPHAQYTMANLFHDGLGTKVDYIQCAAWVEVAIANGFDDEFDTESRCRGQLDEVSNRTATHLADVWKQNYLSPGI